MKDIPEVGIDGGCRNNAGWGNDGYCTLAAMAPQVAAGESYPSCSVDVVKVVVMVAELGRSWRCMVVVGLGCLEGEGGSFAPRYSSRLLSCSDKICMFGFGQGEYKVVEATMEE